MKRTVGLLLVFTACLPAAALLAALSALALPSGPAWADDWPQFRGPARDGRSMEKGLLQPTPQSCQVVSTFQVDKGDGPHWAHPTVADGRLYIRHGDAMMCYDVAAK